MGNFGGWASSGTPLRKIRSKLDNQLEPDSLSRINNTTNEKAVP